MPLEARKQLCQLPCGRALLQQRVQQLVLVYQCVLYGAVANKELVVGQNFHDVVEAAAFDFRPVIVAGCNGAVALCQPVLRRGYVASPSGSVKARRRIFVSRCTTSPRPKFNISCCVIELKGFAAQRYKKDADCQIVSIFFY